MKRSCTNLYPQQLTSHRSPLGEMFVSFTAVLFVDPNCGWSKTAPWHQESGFQHSPATPARTSNIPPDHVKSKAWHPEVPSECSHECPSLGEPNQSIIIQGAPSIVKMTRDTAVCTLLCVKSAT